MTVLQRFIVQCLKVLCWFIGHIPLGFALWSGRVLGRLGFYLDKKHSMITINNLAASFKDEKTSNHINSIAKKVFENLGMNLMEFFRLPWLKKEDLTGYVETEGFGNFERACNKGKGVIFLTGHFGNWELMAMFYALKGYPVDIVVRDLDSPIVDEFVRWVRAMAGNRIISKGRSMRELIRTLSRGGIAGVLLDQNVTWSEGVFVYFFDRLACTNKGTALLAAASGAAVVPTFIVRHENRHKVIIGEEIVIKTTANRAADQLENTALFTKVIEDFIRQYPDQWFWLHQRWKSRPENDPNKGTEKAAMIQSK
ncbi:MAG: lysophospholipid acyltransferase family protein [Deltaproteobacteria bacterium]|nr:lysophospholipid acyltransferase family protein [Deltaproteobacteria bacterium]